MLLVLPFLLAACQSGDGKRSSNGADTTKVVELALRTALGEGFSEMDEVKPNGATDSIYLTTNLFALSKLPQSVDSFKFRIMPDSVICNVIKADTTVDPVPNYLRLQTFQKTDTGYFVELESVYCIPVATKDASVGLHILKTKDRYEFKK